MRSLIAILILCLSESSSQQQYSFCAPESISNSDILSLTKGDSEISCIPVTDSADCAIKINNGEAHFGIFNGEELLLAYQFYPDNLVPIVQLKHPDKHDNEFEFQTVAVVPKSFNNNEGFAALKNGGLCHPGFSESQIWNDYILKFFEKKLYEKKCIGNISVGENEANNIRNFFGKACRPGDWVKEPLHDKELKQKYPELCELCDRKNECTYNNTQYHGHMGALDCLISGRGKVAYVAYHYVQKYFGINHAIPIPQATPLGYQFLCPNGELQPLSVSKPCAWVKQPWSAIVTRKEQADVMLRNLIRWIPTSSLPTPNSWAAALSNIIQRDGKIVYFPDQPSLKSYLVQGREVDLPGSSCGNTIRWCTIDEPSTTKCKWLTKEAQLLGIEPVFSCNLKHSTFDCLSNISASQADIITIDSSYGYIARRIYNLTTILYTDTEKDKNSVVIAVVREDSSAVKNFTDIRNKRVCFPEYGGIAWLSFLNTLRKKNIIPATNNYPEAIANLVIGACTPGINDSNHSDVHDPNTIEKLCSACPLERSSATCSAHTSNQYYGDDGALKCLSGPGDIAVIEPKNLHRYIHHGMIYPGDFRTLCKNGSLAQYTGFDVDDDCALSITIDSEVVGRTTNVVVDTLDTTLALLKMEDWLGYRPYSRRAIRIYESFKGNNDLLFKDSTVGLEPIDSELKSIVAYKELFQLLQTTDGAGSIVGNAIIILISTIIVSITYCS